MRVMQRPSVVAECERCGGRFDPLTGGVCVSCRRVLCSAHLYGSSWDRLRGWFGARAMCPLCRAGAARAARESGRS